MDIRFNAVELNNAVNKIKDAQEKLDGSFVSIQKYVDWSANNYETVDGKLAAEFVSVSEHSESLRRDIRTALTDVVTNIEKYIEMTLANEAATEKEANEISSQLDAISSRIGGI